MTASRCQRLRGAAVLAANNAGCLACTSTGLIVDLFNPRKI